MWIETAHGFVFSAGFIVLIAAALQTLAHMFSNQIVLRILLLIGTSLYLFYYYYATEQPLWPAIVGTGCIGISSIYGIVRELANRSKLSISKVHLPIFEKFNGLKPGTFRKLIKIAEIKTLDNDVKMTQFGVVPDHLYYILEGIVNVSKSNVAFTSKENTFIGEVSIIGGFPATATVHSGENTKVIIWERRKLLSLMDSDDRLRIAAEALFSKDMAKKLAMAVKISE